MSVSLRIRRLIVVAFLVPGLLLLSPGAQNFVLAQALPGFDGGARTRLDTYMELLTALRDQIDRTQFDVDALVMALAFEEPGDIVAWVHDNIAYEAYGGLLRGAQGTLMSRAGNSLDQAVLLGTLLSGAGYDTRIAHAQTPSHTARLLLQQVRRPQRAGPEEIFVDWEAARSLIGELQGSAPGTVPGVLDAFEDYVSAEHAEPTERDAFVREGSATLLGLLAQAGVTLESLEGEADMVSEAGEYFWLEYSLGGGVDSAWTPAHVVFADPPEEVRELVAEEVFSGVVPERLLHRVRMTVTVEQKRGNELHETVLFSPWERPAANLIGRPITLSNVPDNADALFDDLRLEFDARVDDEAAIEVQAALDGALEETRFFYPLLNGNPPDGGNAFDMSGNLVSFDLTQAAAFDLFQQLGGRLESAVGALGGLGARPRAGAGDPLALTAQWLDVTVIAPGGNEQTYRRTIMNRIAEEDRAAGVLTLAPGSEARRSLLASHSVYVSVGTTPKGFEIDIALDELLGMRGAFEELVDLAAIPGGFTEDGMKRLVERGMERGDRTQLLDHIMLQGSLDGAGSGGAYHVYRPAPAVHSLNMRVVGGEDGAGVRASADIISNPRRALGWEDGSPRNVPLALLEFGVRDTLVEQYIVASMFDPEIIGTTQLVGPLEVASATTLLEPSRRDTLHVIGPGTAGEIRALDVPETSRRAMLADVERGYVIVVPRHASAPAAWWRIHPTSGETLGLMEAGEGQAFAEYLGSLSFGVVAANVAGRLVAALFYYIMCVWVVGAGRAVGHQFMGGPSPRMPFASCLAGAGVAFVYPEALGPWLGMLLASIIAGLGINDPVS